MTQKTPQMQVWSGAFGKAYTDRNTLTPDELEGLYRQRLGVRRRAMNQEFLGELTSRYQDVGSGLECGQPVSLPELDGIHPAESSYSAMRWNSASSTLGTL